MITFFLTALHWFFINIEQKCFSSFYFCLMLLNFLIFICHPYAPFDASNYKFWLVLFFWFSSSSWSIPPGSLSYIPDHPAPALAPSFTPTSAPALLFTPVHNLPLLLLLPHSLLLSLHLLLLLPFHISGAQQVAAVTVQLLERQLTITDSYRTAVC